MRNLYSDVNKSTMRVSLVLPQVTVQDGTMIGNPRKVAHHKTKLFTWKIYEPHGINGGDPLYLPKLKPSIPLHIKLQNKHSQLPNIEKEEKGLLYKSKLSEGFSRLPKMKKKQSKIRYQQITFQKSLYPKGPKEPYLTGYLFRNQTMPIINNKPSKPKPQLVYTSNEDLPQGDPSFITEGRTDNTVEEHNQPSHKIEIEDENKEIDAVAAATKEKNDNFLKNSEPQKEDELLKLEPHFEKLPTSIESEKLSKSLESDKLARSIESESIIFPTLDLFKELTGSSAIDLGYNLKTYAGTRPPKTTQSLKGFRPPRTQERQLHQYQDSEDADKVADDLMTMVTVSKMTPCSSSRGRYTRLSSRYDAPLEQE
ncbi:uncharacterized protein LOC106161671 [Lingula anatina]|uniref:Uncharacterized protein LOC106161671 n=1 Tax=Lingula anatina TaxID=7574 RepID=A0A1S3I7B3_LINAN|nr:uncharacterized protein LOC106161671 [Lingula anatina]|eukprot:XP_013394142.1 uncharacterized protein LOC106161671 [Lingula anatina]